MNPVLALQADLNTIKSNLLMSYVLESYGHKPDHQTPGKLHYISPFRADNDPSFDVFMHTISGRSEPEERYGDFGDPDMKQGDVIDLIKLFDKCSTIVAMDKARELLAEQLESEWSGPTIEAAELQALDLDEVATYVELGHDLGSSQTWFDLPRTHPGLTDVVLPRERVFKHPTLDVIVFLLCDENGDIRGVRHRNSQGKKYGLRGTRNILMRLEDPTNKPVFLCEGETDTWAAYGALGDEYEVIGVPGVGTTPERAGGASLAGREVFVAFDPDSAGERGRSIWAEYLNSIGCEVRTVVLPEGKDIAKLAPERIKRLPDRAVVLPDAPENFARSGKTFGIIVSEGKGEKRVERYVPKSSWSFTPTKVLRSDRGKAFHGKLHDGKAVTIPSEVFDSSRSLKAWGLPHDARWYGNDTQAQQLAGFLDHESAYLPEGRIHNQVGLYEGSFVWPSGYIGDSPVEFVPTVAEAKLGENQIFLRREDVNPIEVFEALFNSQHPAVTGPVLAWLAAAPLRTRVKKFPSLNISGVSGSGKSELTDVFLRVFSSTHLATVLSSTTAHAISTQIDNSCGFPVWFDEYRPGAHEGARSRLDQLLRDAYDGQDSAKGGQDRSNLSKLSYIRTVAPIIVTGEDSFTETSHTDRMVLVRLRESEQGPLDRLKDIQTSGFGYSYLEFLTNPRPWLPDPTPPVFTNPSLPHSGHHDVRSRQEMNLRVLKFGWALLEEFLEQVDPMYQMPELDLSRVIQAGIDAGATDPVMELVKVCLENDTLHDTVWRHQGNICIHPQNLLAEHRHHPSIILPVSNADGIRDLFKDKYNATVGLAYTPMKKRIRAVMIPEDVLDWVTIDDEETDANHI